MDFGGARPSFGPGVFYTVQILNRNVITVIYCLTLHHRKISLEGAPSDTTVHVPLDAKIEGLANEIIQRDDLFVVAVIVRGQKGSRLVEVFVDGDEGVSVKELARISRELAFSLDADDVVKGKYLLNVSTPGEERALLFERQYKRHIGKQLVVVAKDEDGSNQFEGENLGVTHGVLTLKISEMESKEVPLDQISKAKIKLPW